MTGRSIQNSKSTQTSVRCAFFLQPVPALATQVPASMSVNALRGIWTTDLRIFGKIITLRFHVTITPDGIETRFDCPKAQIYDRSVLETRLNREIVRFELDDFNATFTGTLDPEGPVIRGLFYRSGFYFPAILTRTDA